MPERTRLHTFLLIAREGNLTRAAEQMHLSQPAVSAQLAGLEQEVGQRLFDRTARGMVLTEAGTTYRAYVEEALERLDAGERAVRALAGLEGGSLSIGGGATATTYLIPSVLGAFHRDFPSIRLFVREQGSQGVAAAVFAGDLDLGIVTLPITGLDRHTLACLRVEAWVEDELRLILPPGHRLRERKTFRWPELQGQPLVLFEAGTAVRSLLDGHIEAAGVQVQPVMELRSIESIQQMVAQGIGAAFVSRYALSEQQPGLYCADGRVLRKLAVVTRRDRTASAAARTFRRRLLGEGQRVG